MTLSDDHHDDTGNTKRLITASGDCQVKLWDVETGEELLTYTHSG